MLSQLISAFVFPIMIKKSLCLLNLKFQASSQQSALLELVGNSDNRFSHDAAHIKVEFEGSCLQRSVSMMM